MTDVPTQEAAQKAEKGYTRLHIAPLDPQLLTVIVPQAALSKARAISYHTLQTFPDRPFGFVELPASDAEKIKNKLNGAVLKGVKIRIEKARPDNMPKPDPDALVEPSSGTDLDLHSKKAKAEKREKKRKRDPQELVGIELEEGRKVKRGWTVTPDEAKAKRKKERGREKPKSGDAKKGKKEKKTRRIHAESAYSDGPECLIKTQLPPNKRDGAIAEASRDQKPKSKKYKKHEVVVHEFKNTTKFPTYLKASKGATATGSDYSFVEGKGWVDSNGELVEEAKSTRPKGLPKFQIPKKRQTNVEDEDTTSSSGSSSEEEKSEAKGSFESGTQNQRAAILGPRSLASPGTMSTSLESPPGSARPKSSSSARSLTIKIPPTTPSSTKVHPLEALYKQQQQGKVDANAITAGDQLFAFFSEQDDDEEDIDLGKGGIADGLGTDDNETGNQGGLFQGSQLPMTPFSKQDLEWRGTRSAAPTPDTAHPTRYSRIWPMRDDSGATPYTAEHKEQDDELDSPGGAGQDGKGEGEATNPNTDFQKWFYEHRSDLNRSWRNRRRVAAKQKRYRENKARAT